MNGVTPPWGTTAATVGSELSMIAISPCSVARRAPDLEVVA